MGFNGVLGSAAGRMVSFALGIWLLVQGTTLTTRGSVAMAVVAFAAVVLGLAGLVMAITGTGGAAGVDRATSH